MGQGSRPLLCHSNTNLQKQTHTYKCTIQFQRWDRASDHCGGKLSNLSPFHHHLYYWRYLEEAFKVIFFSFSIVAGDLYSNMCKYFWLGRTCQTVDSAQRGPSFMWSHEPGVLSVAQRYHRLWRVYHSYKPIQRTAPAMLLQCCNIHLFSCTCKSAVADCGTINYLTRH